MQMQIRAQGDGLLYDVEGQGLTITELKVWLDEAMRDSTVRQMHRAAQRRMLGASRVATHDGSVRWVTASEARAMADELDAAAGDPEFERRVAQRLIDERIGLVYRRMGGAS